MSAVEIVRYSDDELRQQIDAMASHRYGISGEHFVKLVESGDVGEQCGGSADIVALVRLLPEGRFDLIR